MTKPRAAAHCCLRYLWLKVWSPTEAEANTMALQKLDVWPRHRAKTLETPEPMTWKKGEIKYCTGSSFSWRKQALLQTVPFYNVKSLCAWCSLGLCSPQMDTMWAEACSLLAFLVVLSPGFFISAHPCIASSLKGPLQ